MSCSRATEIDLAAFVSDRTASAWSAFRAHYPGCPDCAREVAAWARMAEALRGGGEAAPHLDEADLLAFAGDSQSLAAARRQAIEAHLSGCAPCRTELAVLRGFDFAALRAPDAAPARAVVGPASLGARLAEWVGGWLAPLGSPAWAMAVLALLAIPIGLALWRGFGATPSPPPVAQEEPAPQPPEVPEPLGEIVPRELAQGPETPPATSMSPPDPIPSLPDEAAPPDDSQRIAESAPPEAPAPEAPAPAPGAAPSRAIAGTRPAPALPPTPPIPSVSPQPVDLDRLLAAAPPDYRPKLALAGGSLETVRTSSALRGAADALPEVVVLAPEHVGATRTATPTLYWHLTARSDVPVELTLLAEDGIEPRLERRMAPPVAPGVHALSLAEAGVALAPDTTYLLHVALVPDDARRDLDVIATAAVRHTPATLELARSLAEAGPAGRPQRLAEAGYWIDAFDAVSRIATAHPESERAAAWRASLLEQVGQGALAGAPAKP